MAQSQIRDIYSQILAGSVVRVQDITPQEKESIRTALHRYHRLMREIGGSELSVQATLKGSDAFFRLGSDKRVKKHYSFNIVEEEDEEIPGTLEEDSVEGNGHNYLPD